MYHNFDTESIVTPINYKILGQLLEESNYEEEKTWYLVEGFRRGFSIEYQGPQDRHDFAPNHRLRCGSKLILWNKMMKEVKLKRVAGPWKKEEIPYNSQVQSPVTLVPKGNGVDCRLVFNLSYNFQTNKSVNHYTDSAFKTVKYQDLDHAMEIILREENGIDLIYFGKMDASSAFRNIPLRKTESQWLIMRADHPVTGVPFYFADRTLSFGHGISCRIYQDFALAVGHVFTYRTGKPLCSYLDDVLIIALLRHNCQELMTSYQQLCQLIGLPLSPDKTEGPSPIIIFLGTLINAIDRTIGIPEGKIQRALGELTHLLEHKKITIHYLQKLTGLLNFFCRAIVPGRTYTRRLYDKFKGSNLKRYHHVKVDKELRKDCEMWKTFLTDMGGRYNRPFMDFAVDFNATELEYYTDSSFKACAGYFDGRYFYQQWSRDFIEESYANINLLELYAIAVSIHLWAKHLQNHRVFIYSDNLSSVEMINSASSKCPRCMHLIRHITGVSMKWNTRFFCRHIIGRKNVLADKLSRLEIQEFKRLVPKDKLIEPAETMPQELWPIPKNWWCD